MKTYFILQYKMANRQLKATGIAPALAYILIGIVFYGFSVYLFQKSKYASYLYPAVALFWIIGLGTQKRNDFLQTIFTHKRYRHVRLIENLLIALPFIVVLLYYKAYLNAALLAVIASLLSTLNRREEYKLYIPTPFGKHPFEFIIGFRKTFYLFPAIYIIIYQAIRVHNFYLGVFGIILLGFITFNYYEKAEDPYHVWIFNHNAKQFLWYKIKISILHFSYLIAPIIIALAIGFRHQILILVATILVCYLYISAFMLAKYANFPQKKNTIANFMLFISFAFPPFLLFLLPYFYTQSLQHIKSILPYDKH